MGSHYKPKLPHYLLLDIITLCSITKHQTKKQEEENQATLTIEHCGKGASSSKDIGHHSWLTRKMFQLKLSRATSY